jgi:hypothetical protein
VTASKIAGVFVGVAVVTRVFFGPLINDDAYITFRYSRHLAAGRGFSYNPPAHVLGTSSPLFTLLMSGAAAAGAPIETSAFAVSVAADAATLWLIAAMLIDAALPAAAILSAAALAVLPAFVAQTWSGMETSLYILLIVATVRFVMARSPVGGGVAAGLAALTRPEGILIAGVAAFVTFISRPKDGIRCATIAALFVVPWLVWSSWYFGSFVPASVLAKAAGRPATWVALDSFVQFFLHGRYLAFSGLALVGAAVLWRKPTTAFRVWLMWWAAYALAFIVTNGFGQFTWYYTPLLPTFFCAASVGAAALAEAAGRRVPPLARLDPLRLAGIAGLAIVAGGLVGLVRLQPEFVLGKVWREDAYAAIGRRLAAVDANCGVAAQEIGAIGFAYPGPVLDFAGLVTPQTLHEPWADAVDQAGVCWIMWVVDPASPAPPPFRHGFDRVESNPFGPHRRIDVYRRVAATTAATATRR